jgi:fructan beta-fructosidase
LYAADGEYVLGSFDGRQFQPEGGKHRLWHGNFYAAQTFSNVEDGRRIQIGWGQGIEFPGKPFNQQMTIPVELKLRDAKDGLRMTALPVREVSEAFSAHQTLEQEVSPHQTLIVNGSLEPLNVALKVKRPGQGTLRIEVFGEPVTVDFDGGTIQVCDAKPAPCSTSDDQLELQIIADRGSLEVFVDEGTTAVSAKASPRPDSPAVALFRNGPPISVEVDVASRP